MANTKISDLTAASALAGTETLPVVQGGTTKKATVTQVLAGAARPLTENRTIYVNASTGNDTTGDGSVGAPYATFQKAATVASTIWIGDYVLTIDLTGDFSGEYVSINNMSSAGPSQLVIEGDTATPTNVPVGGIYPPPGTTIKGVHYTGDAIMSSVGGLCSVLQCRASKIRAVYRACLQVGSAITLTGSSDSGLSAEGGSYIEVSSAITVSGTPAYSTGFANAVDGGVIKLSAQPTGSATGPRFNTTAGGIINTGGGGANWLPGNSAGTDDGTGIYV